MRNEELIQIWQAKESLRLAERRLDFELLKAAEKCGHYRYDADACEESCVINPKMENHQACLTCNKFVLGADEK